jgi:hypothetical protein
VECERTVKSQCDLSLVITVPNDLYAGLSFGERGSSSESSESQERDEGGEHLVVVVVVE